MFGSLRWRVICRKDLPCIFSKMYFRNIFKKSLASCLDLTTFWKCTNNLYSYNLNNFFSYNLYFYITLKILVSCLNSKTELSVINKIVLIAFFHYCPLFLSDFVSCKAVANRLWITGKNIMIDINLPNCLYEVSTKITGC